MLNKVVLAGRLTKDPELTMTTSDLSIARFTLAVDRRIKRENEPTADFLNIVAFGKTADFIRNWFTKGKEMLLVGRIQVRTWETDSGEKRYATEIIAEEVSFCGSKKDNSGENDEYNDSDTDSELDETLSKLRNKGNEEGFDKVEDDDDLPF